MLWPLDTSELLKLIQAQVRGRRAIFTDIDDTLIDSARRSRPIAAAWELREWADLNTCPIILVSGADFASVLVRLNMGEVPPVEAVIGAVGTELWLRQSEDGSWVHDRHYDKLMRASGFDRTAVAAQAAALMNELNDHSPELILTFQRTPEHLHKVSLYFFAEDEDVTFVAKEFQRAFPTYHVITCKEIHYNALLPEGSEVQKYCLDIVPATKQTAITYLIEQLGITEGYKAGDSGNDVDMLLNPDPLLPILVGGHKSEARAALEQELRHKRPGLIQYLKDGRPIYIENGERVAAQSILHALAMVKGADTQASQQPSRLATDQQTAAR
ncbi:MAG TPA: HAD family hydrolase [Candidatus Saccharimonadales bacterium]|nr:HAD family hydrolase [Candidatus Saccharimonadales bacterium]